MNHNLQSVLNCILEDKGLTAEQKNAISKSLIEADKELEITAFKLDRTEKVKRTTGILLEETITELEQKRKAVEAQKRELEVESALERIRSRTLLMKDSSELAETAAVLFDQFKQLGLLPHNARAYFTLIDADKDAAVAWMTKDDGTVRPGSHFVPLTIHKPLAEMYEAWKQKKPDYVRDISGEVLEDYLRFLSTLPHVKNDEALQQLIISPPARMVFCDAVFSYGTVGVFAFEPLSQEARDTLVRFAKVFEFAYTRFLDLKQAEAQAREAQIETALERVRAKVIAMSNSNELKEISYVFGDRMRQLKIDWQFSYFWLIDENREDNTFWITWPDNQTSETSYTLAEADESFQECIIAWRRRDKIHSSHVPPQDVSAWLDTFERISKDAGGAAAEVMKTDNFRKGVYYYDAIMKYGSLGLAMNRAATEEELRIQCRFAIEFERAYTRFLDLKQAEAQAREARIEAALERVRSRTLAMHKSDELVEAAAVVFKQLISLGIAPNRLYIAIIKDDSGDLEFWITDEDGSKVSTKFTGNKNSNSSIQKMYAGWNAQKKSIIIDMQGKELADYFQYLSQELHVPFKMGLSQKRRVQNIAYFSNGFIGIASPEPQPEESTTLLERFASVFNLTYTRFSDLQIAEAQTHKAQIEVALERVRARALAMQQPEELVEVAQVLRREMALLGVEELETSSIYILGEEGSANAECWFAIKDIRLPEKKLVADHISIDPNETWVGRQMLEFYNSGEKQISISMKDVQRKEWIDYCSKQSKVLEGYYGNEIPDRTYHLYKFSNGAIGAAAPGDISEESWELLSRAASVFSLAYSRFKDLTQARIDLQRLKEEKQRAESALTELKATQSLLIQSEKMASLGELTAGIAHEIQNPLNFVNNFSEVSKELLDEMKNELDSGRMKDAKDIADNLIQNLEKINHHGKRADAIVKSMLQHSRASSGKKEPTDINILADEYLRLAYHGFRAKDKAFNAKFETDFDPVIGKINVVPQEIGRVILNLINNAFYAVTERKKLNPENYEPMVTICTKKVNDKVEVRVKDNGVGVPQKVLDKIFQPFFTTKPTGQGTGLGLSLSYDIIKAHGGELTVETKEGQGSIFTLNIPINN